MQRKLHKFCIWEPIYQVHIYKKRQLLVIVLWAFWCENYAKTSSISSFWVVHALFRNMRFTPVKYFKICQRTSISISRKYNICSIKWKNKTWLLWSFYSKNMANFYFSSWNNSRSINLLLLKSVVVMYGFMQFVRSEPDLLTLQVDPSILFTWSKKLQLPPTFRFSMKKSAKKEIKSVHLTCDWLMMLKNTDLKKMKIVYFYATVLHFIENTLSSK